MQAPREESLLERVIRVVWQRLFARAQRLDDPADTIDLVMSQQLAAIQRARTDLALVATAQKRLDALAQEYSARAERHERDAREAKARDDATTAAMHVRRTIEAEHLGADATASAAEVAAQRAVLESLIDEMRAQYERLRLRREATRALHTAASAVGDGQASLSPLGGEDRELLLQRAHDTLAEVRARALALTELRKSGALASVGPTEFDASARPGEREVEERLRGL